MKRLMLVCLAVVCLAAISGCKSFGFPALPCEVSKNAKAINRDNQNGIPSRADISLGSITISTPKFTPLISAPSSSDEMTFGDMKKPEKLLEMIRQANMGASDVSYDSFSAGLAAGLAGMQLSTSNTTALSTGANANLDFVKLIRQLVSSGTLNATDLPVSAGGHASIANDASYTRSFKSPDLPADATITDAPDSVTEKLVSLLGASGNAYALNAFDTIRLMAQLHNEMVNIEAFNNFDGMFDPSTLGSTPAGADGSVWAPYRMQFTVSVNPGWYTYKDNYEAVIDLHIPTTGKAASSHDVKFMAVVPQESEQTITELTSAMKELKLAGSLGGTFQNIALKGAINKVSAIAKRLEGPAKNTLHLVSYPKEDTVRIQIRPTRVPNSDNAVLQPTNMLLTAYILVEQGAPDIDDTAPASLSAQTKAEPRSVPSSESDTEATGLADSVDDAASATLRESADLNAAVKEMAAQPVAPPEPKAIDSNLAKVKSLRSSLPVLEAESAEPNSETAQAKKKTAASIREALDSLTSTLKDFKTGAQTAESLRVAQEKAQSVDDGVKALSKQRGVRDGVRNGLYFPHDIDVKYCGSFVRTAFTNNWLDFPLPKGGKDKRFCVTRGEDSKDNYRTLKTLLPQYVPFPRKPFGFVDEPTGFYEDVKGRNAKDAGTRRCYVSYSISNPPTKPNEPPQPVQYSTSLAQTEWKDLPGVYPSARGTLSYPYLGGILCLDAPVPPPSTSAPKDKPAPERIMFAIKRTNARGEEEVQVRTVVLSSKSAPADGKKEKTATVDIISNGVIGKDIPLSQITPSVAAMVGKGGVELKVTEKEAAAAKPDAETPKPSTTPKPSPTPKPPCCKACGCCKAGCCCKDPACCKPAAPAEPAAPAAAQATENGKP